MKNKFIKVCKTSAIPVGGMQVFNKENIEFLIIHQGKDFFALYNKCPHMGGSLGDGKIDSAGYVTCPLHSWQFDPKTGKGPAGYEDSTPSFDTQVKGGFVYIDQTQLLELSQNKKYLVRNDHDTKERFARTHDDFETELDNIQARAKWSVHAISPMRTQKPVPNFDDILFKAAQLSRLPLLTAEKVDLTTTIGKQAAHPLTISMPVYVSHMSFGALSEEAKIALASGTKKVDTVMCSGEGGRNPREFKAAGKYIYEIGTACFTHKDEWIAEADAVEIKIGQAAKPGLGGHLPKEKITPEIAKLRNVPLEQDLISPARFHNINNKQDLKKFVNRLRKLTGGKPIGIKLAACNIEKDIAVALFANPDFITIDGRGGGTGAAPTFIKDNFALPTVYALARARKYLDAQKSKASLIITGGFRTSGDICKALAMGADAVALATSAMMAIGCQQYRTCHSGNCPVGIATQKKNLRNRFSIEQSTKRLVNFFEVLADEINEITQAVGKKRVHDLDYSDLITTDINISSNTKIEHA